MSRATRLIVVTLILCVLMLLALLATPLAASFSQPPAWRATLDDYLAYQAESGPGPLRVMAASHATLPWQFSRDLVTGVYGEHVYYSTDAGPVATLQSTRPVPFPPAEVWCVLLDGPPANPGGAPRRVVFVALHEDLYNAAWLVDEGPAWPPAPRVAGQIAAMGCALPANP